ncbi:MAG: hypothetical protein KIS81_05545 [Maricaulaceae bacterium]|nr:hypothetical protein [Maricaulaceae bacterium]
MAAHEDGLYRSVYRNSSDDIPPRRSARELLGMDLEQLRDHIGRKHIEPSRQRARHITEEIRRFQRNPEDFHVRPERRDNLRILVFAHGGLVTHRNAVLAAERYAPAMLADGYFPIFLIWNSDFPNAYGQYICCVNRRAEPDVASQTLNIPFRIAGDLVSSIGRAPENFVTQSHRFRHSVPPGARHPNYHLPQDSEANTEECLSPTSDGRLNWRLQSRFIVRRGEDLHDSQNYLPRHVPTVIFPNYICFEDLNDTGPSRVHQSFRYAALWPVRTAATVTGVEAGASSWHNMVRRTRATIRLPYEFDPVGRFVDKSTCDNKGDAYRGRGAFSILFQYMICTQQDIDADDRLPITFVGHSMGAIVGNEILSEFGEHLNFDRVIYMGAAAPIRSTYRSVVPAMQRNPDMRFYNLMLHPLAESRELFMGGVAPQGSLLEWIDEYFERPRNDSERALGKWSNVWRTMDMIPPDVAGRMVFRVFPMQQEAQPPPPLDDQVQASPSLFTLLSAIFRPSPPEQADGLSYVRECVLQEDWPGGAESHALYEMNRGVVENGHRCHPRTHGEFTNYSFWRDRYLYGHLTRPAEPEAESDPAGAAAPISREPSKPDELTPAAP